MVFLKKFEAFGFKSFADQTKLNFDSTMIGIVGPNGAGKSNVIDAIKWVLGEQSIKSLRGKKSDDIIFHGSKTKEACEFAQVTLTFDNSKRNLHMDSDEIAVTRKLHRGNGNNEYYINGNPSRLKDIHDIFADTGLAKGSLGIISQGTVNWFADSKPEERRKIFEDAAGISKYTRKKEESLRQLERTQNNLNRVTDITKELYRDIKKLEIQASKAKEYAEKNDELKRIEITILVKDIIAAQKELSEISGKLFNSKNLKEDLTPKLELLLNQLTSYKDLLSKVEIKIDKFNWELGSINEKVNKLELQKAIYENNLAIDMNSSDFQSKVDAIESSIVIKSKELKNVDEILKRNKLEFNDFAKLIDDLTYEEKILGKEIIELNKVISSDSISMAYLEDNIKNKPNYSGGTKTILNNRQALTGILGSVADFIKCDPNHEKALMIALGKNIQNIVVNTNRDVKRAIDFLMENKAGVATFMPVYEMKPKPMKQEHQEILLQLPGFVGLGSDLISCDKKIKPIFEVLLNRIIIAETFDQALDISKYTYKLYKVITLDGQIVNTHGIITGGYNSKQVVDSLVSAENKLKELKNKINSNSKLLRNKESRIGEIKLLLIDYNSKLTERKVNISVFSKEFKQVEDEIVKLKTEYQKLAKKSFDSKEDITENLAKDLSDLTERLNTLLNTREKVSNELNASENSRKELRKNIVELEESINVTRCQINSSTEVLVQLSSKEVENKKVLEYAKQKLNDTYKMTIESAVENYSAPLEMSEEAARKKIERLNKELMYIGAVNMEAADELKEKTERYEKLKAEEVEISEAKDNILMIINELDQKAHNDFETTILKINEELPQTFKYLFGGGSCSIEFTDPTNILTSGIDVKASPPGKHVNSLFALSGGEKTLVALSVLFSILKISSFPLVVLDEAESALDPSNVERFANIISAYSDDTQFLVITHRPGTMERCEKLYGATMQQQGVTTMYQVKVQEAKQFVSDNNSN